MEKFSLSTNTWNKVDELYDDHRFFCICAFMDNIFILGGYLPKYDSTINTCLQFNTKDNNWKDVAGMNEERRLAACEMFEGSIVVSGGVDNNRNQLNTVESYDVIADK